MAPISRREQLELDELLGDIYRGIETLPDNNDYNNKSATREYRIEDTRSNRTLGRAYMTEYELDESSPLVQRHKQELATSRRLQQNQQGASSQQQPQRSTLKRQNQAKPQQRVGKPEGASETQSLASFVKSNPISTSAARATPEHKRRVRIVDHRETPTEYIDDEDNDENYLDQYNEADDYPALSSDNYVGSKFDSRQKVYSSSTPGPGKKTKYINTNKLIYHQEREPKEFEEKENRYPYNENERSDEDEDLDGTTRVEYYHTTWLDRQLDRATRRRSSKELNERQVKEKAMIEELKRNLKNGAITLRQSLKGTSKKKNSDDSFGLEEQHQLRDDYFAHKNNSNSKQRLNSKSIFSSGLATVPRNYNNNKNQLATKKKQYEQQEKEGVYYRDQQPVKVSGPFTSKQLTPKQAQQQQTTTNSMQQQQYNSRTLPHKKSPQQEHQLLQSHYRGATRPSQQQVQSTSATLAHPHHYSGSPSTFQQHQLTSNHQLDSNNNNNVDRMRNPQYSNALFCANQDNDNIVNQQQAQLQQDPRSASGAKSPMQQRASSTLNRMPSATEVVRSALSRSSSQVSLNNLNKTINLLPSSPPPYAPSTTPTHQNLCAASPSLSPSPVDWQHHDKQAPTHQLYSSKTLGHPQQQQKPTIQTTTNSGQIVLQGTRTVGRPPQVQPAIQQPTQQHQQQPAYANPHASLMQHRQEQQSRQPNRNSASIREFNELDSLLRSLSPGASGGASSYNQRTQLGTGVTQTAIRTPAQIGSTTAQITPGYTSKPTQPSFGGFMSQQQQPGHDLYARVQKPHQQINPTTRQPFTIDVTENKTAMTDENCRQQQQQLAQRSRQHEQLSEFEPPTELLPSMEDYQNISKLNPVNNRYWYKPNMSREHAISLLKDKPQGTFIVRDSTSFRGAYGLAVKVSKLPKNVLENAHLRSYNDPSADYIRHFLIEPVGNGVRLKGYANEPVFDNLADLIYQHSLTELALPCKLVIPRADLEDPRFNLKQKQFFDEFLASKEQAKHQPYESTNPNGGYRRYPGDVLVHNEHRIIFQ